MAGVGATQHRTGLGAQSLGLAEKTKVLQVPDNRSAQTHEI